MTNAIQIVFALLIVIFSVIIHEISHGFAALALGDHTAENAGRLTLNPVKHIDPFGSIIVPILSVFLIGFPFGWAKPVPYNPYNLRNKVWGPALVGIAGPAANLIMAIIFGIFIRTSIFLPQSDLVSNFTTLASYIVWLNLVLAIFNLIPIPPLDGSKLLYILIPYSSRNIIYLLEQYGIILVFVFVFFFSAILIPIVSFLFSLLTGLPALL